VRLIVEYLCVDRRVPLWSFPIVQYHVTSVITVLSVLTTEVDVSGVRQHRWALSFISIVVRGVSVVNFYAVLHIVFGVIYRFLQFSFFFFFAMYILHCLSAL
jgi:hypothetical protein